MFRDLSEQCLSIGSGRKFVRAAADCVCSPASYVLVHPKTVQVDAVLRSILDELDSRSHQVARVEVALIDARRLPSSFRTVLNVEAATTSVDPFDSLQEAIQPITAIHLAGMASVSTLDRARWIDFLNMWAANVKRRVDMGRPATALLCSITGTKTVIERLEADTTTHVAWWWGIPSLLELQLICRIDNLEARDATESQWREHLSTAIASGDFEFLQRMWPKLTRSTTSVISEMRIHANDRGWSRQYIEKQFDGELYRYAGYFARSAWGGSDNELSNQPPTSAREAWADGLLYYSPEYGCELHAAAASVIDDKLARARLWRAQNGLISPQLDVARSMMCHRLTKNLGKKWPTCYRLPTSEDELREVQEDPMFCQLGHLSFLLREVDEVQQVNRKFRRLARVASKLRNDLSHLRPIDFSDYRDFHQAARRANA